MNTEHDERGGGSSDGKQPAVTEWLRSIEQGDYHAATELWSYCFPRLLKYSKRKLPDQLKRVLDEEDVALSAFKSFCLAAANGKFPQLNNRDDLWKLLLTIAGRKAQAYVRHELREKRGGGKVSGESIFLNEGDSPASPEAGIGSVAGSEATPDMIAQFTDQVQQLLEMLKDDKLKTVALLRVEGYSVEEIADRLECGKRTIERKLTLIRRTWQEALTTEANGDEKLP